MLTADLALSWQRGGRIRPRYIGTDDAEYLREAEDLIGLFARHEGGVRSALEEELQEYVGTGTDYKILRGLIKLLTDRCAFETSSSVDPPEIRRALFRRAAAEHPVAGEEERERIVAGVAAELNCEPGALLEGLYADLSANQRLAAFDPVGARELLDLYNVAQAQALLYRSTGMRLWVEPQAPEGYRELFGAIKAYGLIHTVRGDSRAGYEISLDGPVSIFQRSQKYGVQMAVFLPALLLCTGWRMRAEITTGQGRPSACFEMTSAQTQLRSHYVSVPGYDNPAVERLAEAWERAGSLWTLEPSREVIDLGASAFIPDYRILHPSGREIYLEILGFWTPRHLSERLAEFEHAGLRNYIVAAWEELRGSRDPLTTVPPHTLVFKKKLDPAVVELMADRIVAEMG